MWRSRKSDYEPVRRLLTVGPADARLPVPADSSALIRVSEPNRKTQDRPAEVKTHQPEADKGILKRGHGFTYVALFLFTVVLYARPAEFYPSPLTSSLALVIGVMTLAIFIASQLTVEGVLTVRPREINLVLLLGLTGLFSIPFALSPSEAWHTFGDTFIRCLVIFIVIVNVVRTESRLRAMLFLTLIVATWLSLGAINDYRLNLTTVEGYRIGGRGSGIFGNSNDMALFLVTSVPIALAFFFSARSAAKKVLFGACALLMIAAIVLTYSRGGFVGLLAVLAFMGWKIGRRKRLTIAVCGLMLLIGLLLFAPGNYALRLASIFIPSLDAVGSSDMRREILYRSIWTALRHPLFGIGMGNFHNVSIRELVSHNAYTQVAAEMGLAALVVYTMFIVTPLRRLGQVVRETTARGNPTYYLAIALQASLLGYMFSSFFASVAYLWYVYYLVGYAVCLRRIYEAETGREVALESKKTRRTSSPIERGTTPGFPEVETVG
jgi:O-antigen ligase